MRELTDATKNEKNKSYNRPVELYQIFLEEEILYLANYNQDIEFFDEDGNEQTYSAYGISRGDISTNQELKSNEVTVEIDNVSREMSMYLANYEFRGKKIRIMKVFLDADKEVEAIAIFGRAGYMETIESFEGQGLENYGNGIIMFEGVMDEPAVDEMSITLNVIENIDVSEQDIPRRKYYFNCPWEFGDPGTCGVDISEENNTKVTGQVDSVETEQKTKLMLSEIDGDGEHYWSYGYIEINNQFRFVKDSGNDNGSGYIIIDMPFFVDVTGEDYELVAGCDKTRGIETEEGEEEVKDHGCSFWDNLEFYGGFVSIAEAEDVKS